MPDVLTTFAGTLGASLYLLAYAGLNLGLIRGEGYLFPSLNLVAALAMLVSLSGLFNPFSAFTEIAWVVISLFGIGRLWVLSRGLSFSQEERKFLEAALPGLSRLTARRFLTAGRWETLPPGTILTREGDPVERLTYIAEGMAQVIHQDTLVAVIPAGLYVGELGVLSREPATATVTVTALTRAFQIDAGALAALVARHPDLRLSLDAGIGMDARHKIISANRRLHALSNTSA